MFLATTDFVQGYQITETLGIVRGSSVRAKWFGADFAAGIKNFVGGEITTYVKLLNEARERAIELMTEDAKKLGADAVIGVSFMTSVIAAGTSEILVYGTAVKLKKSK